jgi:hypothetical protein
MPTRLSRRTTLLLVVLSFELTFAAQTLHADRPSAELPATRPTIESLGAEAPSADPDVRLADAGTVPALREPRVRRSPRTKPKGPSVARVTPTVAPTATATAPTATAPTATATATPTPVPRFSPAPTAAPKPQPKPVATATPPSGEFDTSGEP